MGHRWNSLSAGKNLSGKYYWLGRDATLSGLKRGGGQMITGEQIAFEDMPDWMQKLAITL